MNSIFSNKAALLPNLKRRNRTRTKRDLASPSKGKPLDTLPEVSEEEETRWSTSSASTSSCSQPSTSYRTSRSLPLSGRPASEIKRYSRRVVLTGAEGLTFDDFFPLSSEAPRPAPAHPASTRTSPLDDINLRFSGLGISMDFTSPPPHALTSPSTSSRRDHSPTPSESSCHTSASGSSSTSRKSASTPPTSDDESSKPRLSRSPTMKSQRASVMFMKSMPNLHKESPKEVVVSFAPELDMEEEEEMSDGEDASWFAEDISDIITLSSPLPPSFPSTPTSATSDPRARPDSLPPPPRATGRSRLSKPLPILPTISVEGPSKLPSFQLDPTFSPVGPYRRFIPSRPPPPPPIRVQPCPSPTMEEKTDELLALLANAALGGGFLGTGLHPVEEPLSTPVTPCSIFAITSESARPPPRSSIPADICDMSFDNDDDESSVDLTYYSESAVPRTPESISVYSQASQVGTSGFPDSPLSSFDFEVETPTIASSMSVSTLPTVPESPDVGMYSNSFVTPPMTPPSNSDAAVHANNERTLRSRWSSSTLSSLDASRQTPPSASSWMLRFHLGGSSSSSSSSSSHGKHSKSSSSSSASSPTKSHSKKPSVFKVPLSPTGKRSLDMERGLMRRESTNSRASIDTASDSGDSTASNGLRRKPIPVEIFMR